MNSRRIVVALAAGVLAATVPGAAYADPTTPSAGDTRIIGGRDAAPGAYPWMTHLTVGFQKGSKTCGGTLVSGDIVLTAQQCLAEDKTYGKPTSVTADIGAVNHTQADAAGARRTGTKYLLGAGIGVGDWAVVKLATPLKSKAYPLLPADEAYDAKKTMRALGWGSTSEGGKPVTGLKEVDLPYVAAKDCGKDAANEICAGNLDQGGVGVCVGDGGGPLLALTAAKTWVQVGITSHGVGCGRKGSPGHYTKVSAFTAKIQAAITLIEGEAAQTTARAANSFAGH